MCSETNPLGVDNLQAVPSEEGEARVEIAMFRGEEEQCLGLISLSKDRALSLRDDLNVAIKALWPEK